MAFGFSLNLAKLSLKSSPCLGLSLSVDNYEKGKKIQKQNYRTFKVAFTGQLLCDYSGKSCGYFKRDSLV